jgi:type I restriction enzyme S subunit
VKLDTFFERFDQLAEAPDAVAKLRELVLQLAVQGRLVSQLATDEPTGTLAASIAEDRAAFVKERGLARQRVFASVEEDQYPFALPSGWGWTRLGNLCRVQAGFAFQSAAFVQGGSGVPMIRIRDITKDRTQVNYVGEYREEFFVEAGDYLVGMDGNFTVARWRGPRALLNQRVSRLQWYSPRIEPSFFAIALQHRLSELQGTKAYTTVDHLSSGQIEDAVVPLPPLAEQRRIVAKVDELMALCDRLEAQQWEREVRHAALARASLARFADAPTPVNITFLFHPSYAIPPADLRESILTLAVHGKLVPQDPNDEPILPLLERIAAQKASFEKEEARGRPISVAALEDDEGACELPSTWGWVRFGDIARHNAGKTLDKGRNHGELRDYLTTSNLYWGFFRLDEVRQMPIHDDELERCTAIKGDLLICEGGEAGRAAVWPHDYSIAFQNHVHRARFYGGVNPYYVQRFFEKLKFTGEIEKFRKGVGISSMSGKSLASIVVPLPPLAEQTRIVAKVEQLMALVDELEAQLATSRTTGAHLMEAVVAELTAGI